jgi:cation:H+ antiporter
VAFGTSAPELAVSLKAVFSGQTDVTIGNIVGSNILNVLLILGLAAVFTPLAVKRSLAVKDLPFMIAVSGLTWFFSRDFAISRWEGIVLFGLFNSYMAFLYFSHKNQKADALKQELQLEEVELDTDKEQPNWLKNIAFVILGIGMLVFGSDRMVENAVFIAQALGMSTLLISLTVVAIGTSLPEIATSVVAAIRGEGDIAVGNIVGSNLFNILLVLGLSATVSPANITLDAQAFNFDIPVMFGVALLCLPFFLTSSEISKGEGFFYLAFYVLYTVALIALSLKLAWFGSLIYILYGLLGLLVLYIVRSIRSQKN